MDQIQLARHEQAIAAMLRESLENVDTGGLELLRLIKMAANQYDTIIDERLRAADLSGPRLWVLLRLWTQEKHGHLEGTPPTHLSRSQNVSKNTISALIRGLEEQGLVERTLDSGDRRVFRIRLTAGGRQLVERMAPQHLAYLNQLAGGLAPAERKELAALLQKLYCSLAAHGAVANGACAAETGEAWQSEDTREIDLASTSD